MLCTNTLASLVKGEVLSPEKIRATTGGIASLLSLALHQPFQNRTIPLAFRRVRVCVCLVGFASLQSPWAHTLKASLPCLPLPLHRILSSSQPLQMNNNPSLRTTTLASLVKGRWIDGKAQTVALLHFYLRYIRLFYSPNFLPSRRRDCYTTLRSAPHLCLSCQR